MSLCVSVWRRFEAEKILDRNQDGQFLMRTSQSTEGIYALAVSYVSLPFLSLPLSLSPSLSLSLSLPFTLSSLTLPLPPLSSLLLLSLLSLLSLSLLPPFFFNPLLGHPPSPPLSYPSHILHILFFLWQAHSFSLLNKFFIPARYSTVDLCIYCITFIQAQRSSQSLSDSDGLLNKKTDHLWQTLLPNSSRASQRESPDTHMIVT